MRTLRLSSYFASMGYSLRDAPYRWNASTMGPTAVSAGHTPASGLGLKLRQSVKLVSCCVHDPQNLSADAEVGCDEHCSQEKVLAQLGVTLGAQPAHLLE